MTKPPRRAELLLAALGASTAFGDAIVGDLAEEFARRAERDGVGAARRWYYREAARTAPHLIRGWARGLRRRDLVHLAGIAATSYVFLVMVGGFLAASVYSVVDAIGLRVDTLLPRPGTILFHAIALPLGGLAAVTGGYLAAWLNPRAPLGGAFALAVLWSSVDLVVLAWAASVPVSIGLAVPAVVLVGTTIGGALRVWGVHPAGSERPA